jgi:lipoprotein-anchoring transpeptidase ErfK/SrfK
MTDYYSILLRAVTAPGAGDGPWRRGVFSRARQMLANQLRARQPPLPEAEIAAELDEMDAAIERIESEMAWTERGGGRSPDLTMDEPRSRIARPPQTRRAPRSSAGPAMRLGGVPMIAAVVVVAAIVAAAFVLWPSTPHQSAPPTVRTQAPGPTPAPQVARATAKDGDLAPGVDGGSSDADLPYVLRRQPTFYRTLEPAGTIIVDKSQHYLYLIQPNNVALRYGVGLGDECKDLVGLRHVASKAEWPPWQPPPDMIKRYPAGMPGGPGNPLGARLMQLDDGKSHINGTNAPGTIGSTLALGCIRLVNDDIVDLYSRVSVNAPVVVN